MRIRSNPYPPEKITDASLDSLPPHHDHFVIKKCETRGFRNSGLNSIEPSLLGYIKLLGARSGLLVV